MQHPVRTRPFSRRRLLAATTGALALPCVIRDAEAQGRRIVVRDAGGPFTPAWTEAFYQPFQRATGIQVVGITSAAEPTAEIRSMVETRNYTWNIAGAISLAALDQLVAGGYIEAHQLDDDPAVKQLPPEYRTPYGVGSDVYATAIGYRTDKVRKPPRNWADYWNVQEFPGRRGLRRYPFDTVEEALMADGVPRERVYPCDLDRAFRALNRIRPHIAAWWTSGAQATQMLATGEVDMLPTWANRITAAKLAGAPVEVEWTDNIWGLDVFAILKGTPNADLCREFIRFTCDPQRQAAWTRLLRNGPTHPGAYDHIPADVARTLPTYPPNREKSLNIDNAFWAANKDAAIERFNTWVLG